MSEHSGGERAMNDAVLVSTIIPCYNSASTIAAALESVLEQTLPGVEVIAIDDGSHDATPDILDDFARRLPDRIRVLRQDHAGPYVARNLAASHARGSFLAFLDSDDLWEPEKLERQIALLEANPEAILCHTGGWTMEADGTPIQAYAPPADYSGRCFEHMLVSNRLSTSSVVVREAVFAQLGGFDESFPARGDWELWTRLSLHGDFVSIDAPLIRYRFHAGRMSRDTDAMREHHFRIIEKHSREYRGIVPDLERYISHSRFAAHMEYGSEYLGRDRRRSARREALRAIRRRPHDPRPWKLLAKTLVGPEIVRRVRGPSIGDDVPHDEPAGSRSASG